MKKPSKTWDNIYRHQGKVQVIPIGAIDWLIKQLQKNTDKQIDILDAGCGTGRNILPIFNQFPNSKVLAFDNSAAALKILKEDIKKNNLSKKVKIIKADLDKDLTKITGFYDVVIASLVVHHGYLKDIKIRIEKLKAKLVPAGYFVYATASTLDPRASTGTEVELGTFLNTAQEDGGMPHHYSTPEEIEKLFSGYKVLYKNLATPKMVTGDKKEKAAHWEYVFRKMN